VEITQEIHLGIDDFKTFVYTNPQTGAKLWYQLYIPQGYETKSAAMRNLPLVTHWPSGDYYYNDWDGNYRGALLSHPDCLYWADEEAQAANPAFVVTVGGPRYDNWNGDHSRSEMQQNYIQIIKSLVGAYNIDASRIYAISLAGGTNPMYNSILANPNLFAAQITTAYEPYHVFGNVQLGENNYAKIMDDMPTWLFAGLTDGSGVGCLGANDTRLKGERLRDIGEIMIRRGYKIDVAYGRNGELMWNGLLRGPRAEAAAKTQLDRANAAGAKHLITLYIPGTILQTMHWSWNATYSNAEVRNWLFAQRNDNPALR
jgi:predicted peptidase